MNTKQAILGTTDPRALLLAAGVQAFRVSGGYVPSVAPENECSDPAFTFVEVNTIEVYEDSPYYDEVICEHAYIILDASLCHDCRTGLNSIHESIFFRWDWQQQKSHCEICGKSLRTGVHDDIPF
jgi:hypothetical protein